MASKKSKSSEMKVKKKKWVEIISPEFNNQKIGETHVFEIEQAIGKPICLNLMNLVGDPRKQNTDVHFKTTEQLGETAVKSELQALVVQQPSLRKMVRRGKTKVQDSFKCYTVDKKPIVVKVFMLTRKLVENSVATALREKMKRWAVNRVSKMTLADFVRSVIEGKFRKEIVSELSKIYPVKFIEFNTIKLLSSEKGSFEKPSDDKQVNKKSKKSEEDEEDSENDDSLNKRPKKSKQNLKDSGKKNSENKVSEEPEESSLKNDLEAESSSNSSEDDEDKSEEKKKESDNEEQSDSEDFGEEPSEEEIEESSEEIETKTQ